MFRAASQDDFSFFPEEKGDQSRRTAYEDSQEPHWPNMDVVAALREFRQTERDAGKGWSGVLAIVKRSST